VDSTVLDTIVVTFASAIDAGFVALLAYSLPLLAVFAVIYFYVNMAPVVMGGAHMGDALAGLVWTALKIGIFYWLVISLYNLTLAAFQTFVQWGLAGTGAALTVDDMAHPSSIIDAGFAAAWPLTAFVSRYSSGVLGVIRTVDKPFVPLMYMGAYWLVVLAFAFLALTMVLILIE
jgi:type IV secretory pathway TrbL component